jgi:Ni/Fe-hydrogenase subunit HybB-like protein
MHLHEPVGVKFFTRGMKVLTVVMLAGLGVGLYRMFFGLSAVTNLNDQYPMGLWIGVDVATGVALAAGGFTTGALVYVLRREHFHAVIRPALLTALLGYTFVAIGLLFDLGRWYNVWHPAIPTMWQGNSVLFEVGMCVMCYLTVLYIEFAPVVLERLIGRFSGRFDAMLQLANFILERFMFLFIPAGVVLSCLHQSSLGALTVIAPYKMHPLYWSRLSPIFFLSSAIAVGFPMVIVESLLGSRAFGRKPEMEVLTPLSRMTPWLLGVYIALKLGDMLWRGTQVYLFQWSPAVVAFWIEFGLLTVVPFFLFLSSDVRQSPGALFTAALMYVFGVLLNRCAVFFIAYEPLYAEKAYVPALGEFALTIGLIATIMFAYRTAVTWLPVLPRLKQP